jgi:hypothetical protein
MRRPDRVRVANFFTIYQGADLLAGVDIEVDLTQVPEAYRQVAATFFTQRHRLQLPSDAPPETPEPPEPQPASTTAAPRRPWWRFWSR